MGVGLGKGYCKAQGERDIGHRQTGMLLVFSVYFYSYMTLLFHT